jgi:AcrR family transcriptional regulator
VQAEWSRHGSYRYRMSSASTGGVDRRKRLLETGLALLDGQDLVTASVDDICDSVGVAHGLLFHYFGSKKRFYVEVLRESFHRLGDEFAAEFVGDARAWIEHDIGIVINSFDRHLASVAVAQSVGASEDLVLLMREIQIANVERIAKHLEIDTLSPTGELAIIGWQNYALSIVGTWRSEGELTKSELVAFLADSFEAIMNVGRLSG